MKTDSRIPELDGFRGVAILTIVVLHFVDHHLQAAPGSMVAYAQKYFSFLWIGVDAFFVLSGYLIAGILIDHRESASYFSTFYVRRSLRIFPPYLLLLGLWVAVQSLPELPGSRWLLQPRVSEWPYFLYVQNFSMAAAGSTGPNFVAATWSLAVEEQFYLLLPLVVWLVPPRLLPRVLAIGVVLAPVIRCVMALLGPDWLEAQSRLLPTRWDSLLLGALVAWATRQSEVIARISQHRKGLLVTLSILAVAMAGTPLALRGPEPFHSPWRAFTIYLMVGAFFALVLLALHLDLLPRVKRALSSRVLRFFGKISYFLYLFHTAVLGLAFAIVLGKEPVLATPGDWLVTAVAFALVVALAQVSWAWVEGPLVRQGHKYKYANSRTSEAIQPASRVTDATETMR